MPNRKHHSEPEVNKLLKLIDDYKIHFVPPITSIDWELSGLSGRHLFDQILQIQNVKFVQYPPEGHNDHNGASQKKLLVRRIQANAARCKREKDNEAGWINNVANLVFNRLDGFEYCCQRCRCYLWLPDFVALPSDNVAADRLRRRYRHRSLCRCTAAERAEVVRVDYVRASIFSNKSDERVMHRDSGLENEVLDQKYKRPDRVYGLGMTSSFTPFKERSKALSPFQGAYTLLPFLLLEAKSEKSAGGFEEIERQTALSIRTCLKLQVDLEQDSSQILDPVVWFFGFRGDVWRLYLASMVGDETKVVDCWHGYLQNSDEALQLLLLVDWICGWAKDVYREGVLRCLAGLTVRDATPAGTIFSFQGDHARQDIPVRSSSLVFRSSQPFDAKPHTSAQQSVQPEFIHVEDSEDEIMEDDVNGDYFPALEDSNEPEGVDLEENWVVRKAYSPVYRWKHLDIPEDESILSELLDNIDGFIDRKSAASFLWHVLTDEENTAKVSLKIVSEVLRDSMDVTNSEFACEEPIATLFICQRRLVETSWQMICNFWCITCSQSAASLLAEIAGISGKEKFEVKYWRAHDCTCLAPIIKDMGYLEGRASAIAAIKQDIYCLIFNTSRAQLEHPEWRKASSHVIRPQFFVLENLFKPIEGVRQNHLPSAVRSTTFANVLSSELFETNDLDGLQGVLLRRPAFWPDSCPLWCFLQFDDNQQESIETQIATAYRKKAIFGTEEWNHDDDEELLQRPERWRE